MLWAQKSERGRELLASVAVNRIAMSKTLATSKERKMCRSSKEEGMWVFLTQEDCKDMLVFIILC